MVKGQHNAFRGVKQWVDGCRAATQRHQGPGLRAMPVTEQAGRSSGWTGAGHNALQLQAGCGLAMSAAEQVG